MRDDADQRLYRNSAEENPLTLFIPIQNIDLHVVSPAQPNNKVVVWLIESSGNLRR